MHTDYLIFVHKTSNSEAPRFLVEPTDVQVALGDTVDIPCAVEGRPEPVVTWTFNGANVRVNSRISLVSGGLHIVSVRDEDRGVYQCRAENSAGTITAAARLNVHGEKLRLIMFISLILTILSC